MDQLLLAEDRNRRILVEESLAGLRVMHTSIHRIIPILIEAQHFAILEYNETVERIGIEKQVHIMYESLPVNSNVAITFRYSTLDSQVCTDTVQSHSTRFHNLVAHRPMPSSEVSLLTKLGEICDKEGYVVGFLRSVIQAQDSYRSENFVSSLPELKVHQPGLKEPVKESPQQEKPQHRLVEEPQPKDSRQAQRVQPMKESQPMEQNETKDEHSELVKEPQPKEQPIKEPQPKEPE
eukprot:PhF_6_TR808/c0_g1_i1/m.1232